MLFTETPTEPEQPPSATEPPPSAQQPVRVLAGRHGEWDTHELIHLLDTIEDERARGRFRESLYISFFVWIAIAWVIFYGPRVLWHQPKLRTPELQERELTRLNMPAVPHLPAPVVKPVHPTIDSKTMEHLRETAPKPAPLPSAPQPQPTATPPPTPPPPPPVVANTPRPHIPPPVVADAPTAQPSFAKAPSAGNAIQQALNAAAHDRSGGNIGSLPGRRGGPLNLGGAEVLSDTQGVDFGPYLRRILGDIKRNWDPLIPPEAESPLFKQGETYIRFSINPDGSIAAMHLDGSTHDEAINKSCWGSITSEGQFPPLPKEFKGPNLELRIHYLVNKQPQD